jgi:hypothetical protein
MINEQKNIMNDEKINIIIETKEMKLYNQVKKAQLKYYLKNKQSRIQYATKWNKDNKEKYNHKANEYYNKNKDKLKQKKIICECGATIQILGKSMHLKTNKHLTFINKQVEILI